MAAGSWLCGVLVECDFKSCCRMERAARQCRAVVKLLPILFRSSRQISISLLNRQMFVLNQVEESAERSVILLSDMPAMRSMTHIQQAKIETYAIPCP